MKKKGFTLIELLAVIVILAIIAVIATPIITGIIEDSKKASFERSVEGIIKGLDLDVAFRLEDGGYTYTMTDGVITELEDSNISISNTKGYSGKIKYDSEANVSYAIYNDKWCAVKKENDVITTNYKEGECVLDKTTYKEEILNGTYPILDSKMIAINYTSEGLPKVVDSSSSEWYSYANRKWANAVVLVNSPSKTYNVGDTLLESDVAAYFVWIPRFKYTLKGPNSSIEPMSYKNNEYVLESSEMPSISTTYYGVNGISALEPGYYNVLFVNEEDKSNGTGLYTDTVGNYKVAEAFTFGSDDLTGFWVGKFTTTYGTCQDRGNCLYEDVNTLTDNVTIKPNTLPLTNQNVSTQFEQAQKIKEIYNMSNETRMMKNSEWIAVAILSQSLYGRCPSTGTCPEIEINEKVYTGYTKSEEGSGSTGGRATSGTSSSYDVISENYSLLNAVTGSTTHNITGVFDMNGGLFEYVMAVLLDENNKPYSGYSSEWNSGYNGYLRNDGAYLTDGKNLPDIKYYDTFTLDIGSSKVNLETGCNGGMCLGMYETKGWYSDYAGIITPSYPWLFRAGNYDLGAASGLWCFNGDVGVADNVFGFRAVLSPLA